MGARVYVAWKYVYEQIINIDITTSVLLLCNCDTEQIV